MEKVLPKYGLPKYDFRICYMFIVAVIGRKGGIGQTTLCANLGSELAALGRRVTRLDTDPQQSLIAWARLGKGFLSKCVQAVDNGSYLFSLGSPVDQLNENVVFGLFTWDNDACESSYNELDVEFSRFGQVGDPNAQYVVQPFDTCGRFRFNMPTTESSTHMFDWEADRVSFLSLQGSDPIQSSEFREQRCIPAPINGNARINLWMFRGSPPSDGQAVEVVITDFQFTPSSP